MLSHGCRALLVIVVVLTTTGSLPSLGQPAYRIVYVTSAGAMATLTTDGRQPTLVSPTDPASSPADSVARRYAWPTWSPDGRRIAFLAIDDYGASGAVFVADADGSSRVTLTEFADSYPVYLSWAPDGRAVAVLVAQGETQNLLLVDARGRGDPRLIDAGLPLYSSWAPDSQALLVHAGGWRSHNALPRLTLVSIPSAHSEQITVDPHEFRAPAWSPAGPYQALAGTAGVGGRALFLRHADGQLRRFAALAGPPAMIWSPTGDRLAWSSAAGFPYFYDGLQIATPDGRTALRIVDEPLFAFFWSPDGTRIAYLTVDRVTHHMHWRVIPASGGHPRMLAAFQPTRDYVQLLSYFDQYAQSVTIWSPDSRALLYAGWPPESEPRSPPGIYAVAVDGGSPPRLIVPGRIGFPAPAAEGNGRR